MSISEASSAPYVSRIDLDLHAKANAETCFPRTAFHDMSCLLYHGICAHEVATCSPCDSMRVKSQLTCHCLIQLCHG